MFYFKINDAEEEKKAQGLKEVIRQSFKASSNGSEEGTSSSNAFQGESSACSSSPSVSITNFVFQHIVIVLRAVKLPFC